MPRRRLSSVTIRAWGGFVAVMALLLAAGLLIGRQLEDARTAREAVAATGDRMDRLDLLLRELLDAEVGQRGYVITGDDRFLDPYRASAASVDDTFATIVADARASHNDPAHVARLRELVAAKFRFINRNIEQRRSQGPGAAMAEVAGLKGKRLMDAIRIEIARMIAFERAQLAKRNDALLAAEQRTQRVVYAALVVAMALVLAIGLMLLRQLRGRIRAQRNAQQAASLLRITLDNVGSGVAVVDPDGRVVLFNAELLRLLPEVDGNTRPAPIVDDLTLVGTGRPALFERELHGATLIVRGVPLPSGRYLLAYLDVTEARRADRVKSEFVTTVSHELRTPVTSIRGSLSMLSGPLAAGLSDKQKSLVDIALRNADRLTLLVNDILDIEKIESGRMDFVLEDSNLNALLREAAEANRAYAEARGVILAIGTLPRPLDVRVDPNRMQQVMANLISNAVKFSDPGAIVTITAEANGDTAHVSVNDRGPGIPEEFRARIFERFAQADASDARAKGGTGLGLAIAKAIVERHGGQLGFESRPGDTTFSFSVPLCRADRAAA